jgi:hypothetical protein
MTTAYENSGTQLKAQKQNSQSRRGAEIQTKGMGNLFNEPIAKNFPNLNGEIHTQVMEAF